MDDVDDSVNKMCKKVYTVFRSIPKTFSCPTAQRDNMADQFTPQDDLLTMEKTVRDFLKHIPNSPIYLWYLLLLGQSGIM